MDKKAAAIVGGLAAAAGLVAAVALTRKPAEAAPPEEYKYFCIFGDGFKAKTWAEMMEHYKSAHPDQPIMDVEVKWV